MPLGGLQQEQRGCSPGRGALDEREHASVRRLADSLELSQEVSVFSVSLFFWRGEGGDGHPAGLSLSSPNQHDEINHMRARPTVLSIQFVMTHPVGPELNHWPHAHTEPQKENPRVLRHLPRRPRLEAEPPRPRTHQGWAPYLQPAEGSDLPAFGSTLPCAPPPTRLTSDPRAWKRGTGLQDLDKIGPQLKTILDALTFRYSQRLPASLSPGRDSACNMKRKTSLSPPTEDNRGQACVRGTVMEPQGTGPRRRMHAQWRGRSRCPDNGRRRAAEPRASSHASAGTLGSWRSSLSNSLASGYWGL